MQETMDNSTTHNCTYRDGAQSLDVEDTWFLPSDLSPETDNILAIFFVCSGVISICLNSLMLFTIGSRRRACHSVELLLVNMAVCDLLQTALCLPTFAAAAFMHGWQLGIYMCVAEAFLVFYFGCVAIWNLAAMTMIRYIKTCHCGVISEKLTSSRAVAIVIVICYVHSAVWCVAPLVGWGEYGPEPYGISCSINWTCTPLSYIVGLFVMCYGLPIGIMVFCYSKMIYYIHEMEAKMSGRRKRKQRYLTRMTAIMFLFFLLTWTPYAITALMYVGGVREVPYLLSVGSPVFAKTSLWTNPFVYFFTVKRFRSELFQILGVTRFVENQSSFLASIDSLLNPPRKSDFNLTPTQSS